jgi:hypothetical protein
MKIIVKFGFVVLVACFVAMGGVKALAYQSCDQACQSCMQICGNIEAACIEGCGSMGVGSCMPSCRGNFAECSTQCYSK